MIGSHPRTSEISAFPAGSLRIGPLSLPNRVILAPMSGITDAPFRRLAERLGAGLVVSEMTACAGLAARRARGAACAAKGQGVAIHVVQLAGCEAQLDGGGRPHRRGARRRDHRHQHGLPGEAGHQRRRRFRADARPRSCADADRGDSRRCRVPVTLKMRLGWDRDLHQRARAGAPRASGRRADDHRARPHPLPVLRRPRRLGRRPRGESRRCRFRSSSTATSAPSTMPRGARSFRRRCRHDRPRRARAAVVSGAGGALSRHRQARTRAAARRAARHDRRRSMTRCSSITASQSAAATPASIWPGRSIPPRRPPARRRAAEGSPRPRAHRRGAARRRAACSPTLMTPSHAHSWRAAA